VRALESCGGSLPGFTGDGVAATLFLFALRSALSRYRIVVRVPLDHHCRHSREHRLCRPNASCGISICGKGSGLIQGYLQILGCRSSLSPDHQGMTWEPTRWSVARLRIKLSVGSLSDLIRVAPGPCTSGGCTFCARVQSSTECTTSR